MRSLILAILDIFKCLSTHVCDDLNKEDANVCFDFIDAFETLCKELFKSLKIARKFMEELKLVNLEKDKLIVRLDESNKKNEFLRNQFSSQDKKMKILEKKLAESKAKLENLSNTKILVDNKSVSVFVPIKPKDKIYIPPFKRNHKEKAYVAKLDKGKSSYVDAEVSKPKSKPTIRVQKTYVFVPTCHLCGVVGHIRPNCSLLRQKPKSMTKSAVRNTDVPKFFSYLSFLWCLWSYLS